MHPAKRRSRASHGCQRKRMAAQDSGVAVGSLETTWRQRVLKVFVDLVRCSARGQEMRQPVACLRRALAVNEWSLARRRRRKVST